MSVTLAVIAKAPVPGRSKTRLCPPCTPEQAAALAEAALCDTLGALAATPARRRVLVLDGAAGPWLPGGHEVIPQRGHGLAERLACAFDDIGGPVLLVGMDTPQLAPADLAAGIAAVGAGRATLGLAPDGGYWAIGLPAPDPAVFAGIAMSTTATGAAQLARLRALGHDPLVLGALLDVDRFADALVVARASPRSQFARAVAALHPAERAA